MEENNNEDNFVLSNSVCPVSEMRAPLQFQFSFSHVIWANFVHKFSAIYEHLNPPARLDRNFNMIAFTEIRNWTKNITVPDDEPKIEKVQKVY